MNMVQIEELENLWETPGSIKMDFYIVDLYQTESIFSGTQRVWTVEGL